MGRKYNDLDDLLNDLDSTEILDDPDLKILDEEDINILIGPRTEMPKSKPKPKASKKRKKK